MGGEAPILARMLRSKLEAFVPNGFGRLASFANSYRKRVSALVKEGTLRRRFWENFSDGPIAERVLSGQMDEAKALMELALKEQGINNAAKT